MFCENCGKENPAGATFCEGCGGALEGAQVENAGGNEKVKKIAIIAGAVAAVVILLAIFGVFTPGSVKALKKMHKGYLNANAKAVWAVSVTPYSDEWEMDKEEKKEAIEEAQEELKEDKQDRKDDKIKISYKNYKVSKKYKKNDVKKIAEYMEENMGYDMDEYKLQAVQVVKYSYVRKEDGDKDTDTTKTVMMKVKGKWYTAPFSEETVKNILKADKED